MLRTAFLTATVLVASTMPAFSQSDMKWKLRQGDAFGVKETSTIDLVMEVAGERQKVKMSLDARYHVRVAKKSQAGGTTLEFVFGTITATMGNSPPTVEKGLVGATLQLEFDKSMKLKAVHGYERMVRKLFAGNPAGEATFRSTMSEAETGRRLSEIINIYLPGRAYRPGDTWKKSRNITVGNFGAAKIDLEFASGKRLTGRLGHIEQLKISGSGSTLASVPRRMGAVVFKNSKFTIRGISGTVKFDRKAGRLDKLEVVMPVQMTFDLSMGGQTMKATARGRISQSIEVTPANTTARKRTSSFGLRRGRYSLR